MTDRPELCRLDVDLGDGRGYLVLRDAWAPGWCATVDGEPQPILKADVAFRSVALREGKHIVEFRYEPLGTCLGLPLAAAGLMLALGAMVLPGLLRRKH